MRDLFRTNPFSYMTKCEVYFNISSFAVVVFNERGAIEIGTYNLQSFPQTHRIRTKYSLTYKISYWNICFPNCCILLFG